MSLEPAARFEILDLLAEYCRRVDEYDIDGMAELFTHDCVTDYGPGRGGTVSGRDAVRDRIASGQSQFRRTHHQLGQTLLELGPTDSSAHALTYVTAWHEDWDGGRHLLMLRYGDRLERASRGWLIARRTVRVAGVEGFPGVPWAWVDRRLPS